MNVRNKKLMSGAEADADVNGVQHIDSIRGAGVDVEVNGAECHFESITGAPGGCQGSGKGPSLFEQWQVATALACARYRKAR
jgi:hypothetical protein